MLFHDRRALDNRPRIADMGRLQLNKSPYLTGEAAD